MIVQFTWGLVGEWSLQRYNLGSNHENAVWYMHIRRDKTYEVNWLRVVLYQLRVILLFCKTYALLLSEDLP